MRGIRVWVVSLFGVVWVALGGAGCSDFRAPTTAGEVITHPLGTQAPFQRGSSKSEVLAAWGNPDQVVPQGVDELGNRREEWVYRGRLPAVPIDYEYVSRTKHLFFEGDNLIRWTSEDPSQTE